jgi:hypothetical protein
MIDSLIDWFIYLFLYKLSSIQMKILNDIAYTPWIEVQFNWIQIKLNWMYV